MQVAQKNAMATPPALSCGVLNGTIPNGCWTVTGPMGHRTFAIETQKYDAEFAPGKRVVYLLTGPDNTDIGDWKAFAFVSYDSRGVNVWRKFRGSEDRPSESEFYAVILERLFAGHTEFARRTYRLEGEKTCLRCNRRLTTPESIEAGIGPKCRSRIRGGR